jgi:hypothetical protein
MKTTIDVATRAEGHQIRRALADPQVRAFVRVMGTLAALPSDRARAYVLRLIDDHFAEENPAYRSVFQA